MWKFILAAIAVVIVFGGGYWFLRGSGPAPSTTTGMYNTGQASTTSPNTPDQINPSTNSGQAINPNKKMTATLHTSMGDITIEFYGDQAPKTVENFVKLSTSGFYDNTKFHRIIQGFMNQGGDPLSKDDSQMNRWGTGGPGYTIQDEFGTTYKNTAGTIAMANTGAPNSSGSQFFINAVDNNFLDGKYTVFGKVTSGMDVVIAMNKVPTSNERPLSPVVLKSVTIAQ